MSPNQSLVKVAQSLEEGREANSWRIKKIQEVRGTAEEVWNELRKVANQKLGGLGCLVEENLGSHRIFLPQDEVQIWKDI
jgi:hypothetical protein